MQVSGLSDAVPGFQPPVCPDALEHGARNLLLNCAGITPGQSLLIVHEDPALGWYDAATPEAVARVAHSLGARVDTVLASCPESPPPDLEAQIAGSDAVIFFARVGDRKRFCSSLSGHVCVVSYARTAQALASDFGTRDHHRMVALKEHLDSVLHQAANIRITCPLGTELTGAPPDRPTIEDVTIRRFPWCMPAPVLAAGFSGTVALSGWLTPTGSRNYSEPCLALDDTIFAEVTDGRIAGFTGPQTLVEKVRAHYERIAATFGIEPYVVHSWHAGIHDGCTFPGAPADDPDLWANTIFGSPSWLHFHTCGNYAPGEICWMIENPTIAADGQAIWNNGSLAP